MKKMRNNQNLKRSKKQYFHKMVSNEYFHLFKTPFMLKTTCHIYFWLKALHIPITPASSSKSSSRRISIRRRPNNPRNNNKLDSRESLIQLIFPKDYRSTLAPFVASQSFIPISMNISKIFSI